MPQSAVLLWRARFGFVSKGLGAESGSDKVVLCSMPFPCRCGALETRERVNGEGSQATVLLHRALCLRSLFLAKSVSL